MTNQFFVSCPMDCFDLCRFIVEVKDNKIISFKGDPDHPLTKGVICAKARQLVERISHPSRITQPLIRTSQGFEPVSYDRVFDLLAQKLTDVKKEYGTQAILNYTSDGYGGLKNRIQSIFFNHFGGDTRFSGSLCWSAGLKAQAYDFGKAMASHPNDLLNSDLVIVWGRNPKVTNLHLYTLLTRAKIKGSKIVVIDPIETATAKSFKDHVRIRPGTDGALALAMAHVLIKEGLLDKDFICAHVKGFKRFEQKVLAFTPENGERETGIPQKRIHDLAMAYGRAKNPSIYLGYGMQRYENGGNAVRCINALAAVSGHMARPGAGVNYASKSLAPYLSDVEDKSQESVKNQRCFPAPFFGSFMAKADDPPIEMGFFTCANPLVQTPDLTLAKEGFAKIGFKVVIDHFLTDTAAHADLILPGATVFEQEDIFVTSMYSHILNFSQKALEPPKTLMPEFEFYLALSKIMGMDLGFTSSRDYLEQCAAPLIEELRNEAEYSDIDFKDLPFSYVRVKSHDIAWKEKSFLTPSGKIEIYSEQARADGLSPLPDFISPLAPPKGFPFRLLTCHCKKSMHSQGFMENTQIPKVHIHPATADRLKLKQGDMVEVKGENGQIEAVVESDDAIYENTAFIYQGFWHKSGAVNFLTKERMTDMGCQAAYYDSFCSLTPI